MDIITIMTLIVAAQFTFGENVATVISYFPETNRTFLKLGYKDGKD